MYTRVVQLLTRSSSSRLWQGGGELRRSRAAILVRSYPGSSILLRSVAIPANSCASSWTASSRERWRGAPTLPPSTAAARSFSDRLLGYSPMAPRSTPSVPPGDDSTGSNASSIPTAADVTTSGGVWAPTSAKRERLRELKVQLTEDGGAAPGATSLDDLASPDQLLDLYLADGLHALTRLADESRIVDGEAAGDDDREASRSAVVRSIVGCWAERSEHLSSDAANQAQWTDFLAQAAQDLEERLIEMPPERSLRQLRDFYLPSENDAATAASASPTPTTEDNSASLPNTAADESSSAPSPGATSAAVQNWAGQAELRLRLLLALGAAQHLQGAWKDLTTVTDQDVDRAAVRGEAVDNPAAALSLARARAVLEAFLVGNAADRVDALWGLVDRDGDGLLDEVEAVRVCELAIEPHRRALTQLFQDALKAHPVRSPLNLDVDDDAASPSSSANTEAPSPPARPPGWRQRRREAKERKRLTRTFESTLQSHFLDEVEMPHRLRCIYAWANKAHQGNRIESVMVDEASGWSGRQRYVELHPKISLAEFREVQREHFPHLERAGSEFVNSFREELWIAHGKGRNRRKLIRNCSLFLAVVCSTDFLIGVL